MRVSDASCAVRPVLQGLIPQCYGEYSRDAESKTGFGPLADGVARYTKACAFAFVLCALSRACMCVLSA